MDTESSAELLELTTRAIYEHRGPQDMHPGQWAVLRYMAQASSQTRTIAGVSNYLGMTMGPASRAVSALARKKFLDVKPLETDRRKRVIRVTRAGRRVLENDPILKLADVLRTMPSKKRDGFLIGLTYVREKLAALQLDDVTDLAE